MVQSFCGVGKSLANSSATDGSTGRNPVCAQTFCPSGVYRKFFSAVALSKCALEVTTATGFSILNVCGGLMCSTGLPWRSTFQWECRGTPLVAAIF